MQLAGGYFFRYNEIYGGEIMIKRLSKAEYKGFPLEFKYVTPGVFRVKVSEESESFSIQARYENFSQPKVIAFTDHLYADFRLVPEAYGYFVEDTLCGVLEVDQVLDRMRITEIIVFDQSARKKGIGTALMNYAKALAKEKKVRMIMLETQTCNIPAISFYRKQGFKLIGFDVASYTNSDIEKDEVRIEMGYGVVK